jgi:glutamine synthetase adenylyltransferase
MTQHREGLKQYFPKKDGTTVEQPSTSDLQKLTAEIGDDAVTFLCEHAEVLKEVPAEMNYYVDVKFVAMMHDRVIEIGLGKSGATEIHFSSVNDYITTDATRFERTFGELDFGSSLKFMRFMDQLLSKMKKDAKLMILGATAKRGKLFQQRIDHYGLTHAFVASFSE